ncbi:MAG: hypothetical protein QNK11_02915 [Legionella sp.]|nr:hypothetical protein [Legionella sp.]
MPPMPPVTPTKVPAPNDGSDCIAFFIILMEQTHMGQHQTKRETCRLDPTKAETMPTLNPQKKRFTEKKRSFLQELRLTANIKRFY